MISVRFQGKPVSITVIQVDTPTSNAEEAQVKQFYEAVKRREANSKGEKERYKHLNAEFQRIARRDKKASSAINAKK